MFGSVIFFGNLCPLLQHGRNECLLTTLREHLGAVA